MREHIRVLGILNLIMGGFVALAGVVILLIMGGIAGVITAAAGNGDDRMGGTVVAVIGVVVAIFFLILAAPTVIGGWGLLKFRPWSRPLMIVVSVFHLLHVPLGTALGVYGLWVLFSEDARRTLESGGHMYVPPPPYPATAVPPQQPTYPPPGI
jgi:hypothetical protein